MKVERTAAALFLICLLSLSLVCGVEPPATVTFILSFPGANPSHYEIVVGSDGQGSYKSDGKIDERSDAGEEASLQFTPSDKTREQIFNLARQAHYFEGKADSGRKNIANTGEKTLAYKDAAHDSHTTYNYSTVQPVAQLTSIFQGLSTTLEFGRRLEYFHKYEKLALDNELKKMEELQEENMLGDIHAIEPTLRAIAKDSSVMNVSRARALRLLASAGK